MLAVTPQYDSTLKRSLKLYLLMIDTPKNLRFLNATLQFLLTMTVESTSTIPYLRLALSISNIAFHFELPCFARKSCKSFAA